MRLELLNFTQEDISCRLNDKHSTDLEIAAFLSSSCPSLTIDLPNGCKSVKLIPNNSLGPKDNASLSKEWLMKSGEVIIELSLARSANWRIIPLYDERPWRIYLSRVSESDDLILTLD